MYCGDETGSFIGELTSSSCRFGYGGEDCPKSVLSSFMYKDGTIPVSTNKCYYLNYLKDNKSGDTTSLQDEDVVPIFQLYPRRNIENSKTTDISASTDPNDYLNNGYIENFDAWENAWHKSFQALNVNRKNKHTTGGKFVQTKRKFSSGMQSSTISSTEENENGEIIHPILAIDHGNTHLSPELFTGEKYNNAIIEKQKNTMLEILYESLSAPATFIAPSPMLASFGNGRQTSLVVDIGAGGTRVTPIVDGLVLQQAQRRNGRGGDWLGAIQERVVQDIILKKTRNRGNLKAIIPRYALGLSPKHLEGVQKSIFHQMAIRDCMYEMKTAPHVNGVAFYRNDEWTIPFLKPKDEDDEDIQETQMEVEDEEEDKNESESDDEDEEENIDYDIVSKKSYHLPDGTKISLEKTKDGKDLCRLNELLFASELPFSTEPSSEATSKARPATHSDLPIHELIKDSLSAVADADVRKELCGNIILTGAASLVTNIEQRLSLETQYLVPGMYKCKVIASRNSVERRYASWIGASVLSSLGSFQQLWLSRREYEEYGTTLASQRFP